MRRLITALAATVTVAAVTATSTGAGVAARGVLEISGNRIVNPGPGCYTGQYWPLSINNRTDTRVFVFGGEDCQGTIVGTVDPGGSGVFEFANSVRVPR
ncbi:hypothetical protein ACFQ08_25515 [Streptosporangium algeriense]|uniref:Secreted protein n=1 Tax=Streptosporangium algeriense TaxID=1682748 RepID=A0ABW3DVN7_9ACTN